MQVVGLVQLRIRDCGQCQLSLTGDFNRPKIEKTSGVT